MEDETKKEVLMAPREPDAQVLTAAERVLNHTHAGDADDDELLDLLDDEDDFGPLRERRMEELKEQIAKLREMQSSCHGRYTEMSDEKEIIKLSASEELCVIHFAHRDFRRCKIMDEHLEVIAPKYFSTRFVRVYVESTPWLVEKLGIKVLPCLMCFIKGIAKHRLVGFEDMGNDDNFKTSLLEMQLSLCGVIKSPYKPFQGSDPAEKLGIGSSTGDDSEEDFDL